MKENDESSKCSANKYSAYQMRVASKACYEGGHRTVAAMLRQAAEVMEREEREKKYEYSVVINGLISIMHEECTPSASKNLTIVRRSVGEWEKLS